jgi:hypothetical protein
MFEVLVTGSYWREQFSHQAWAKIKSLEPECAAKTLKQGLLYVGLMRTVGCAISTDSLKEDEHIFGAMKERGAV